jgi:hypothetical protein
MVTREAGDDTREGRPQRLVVRVRRGDLAARLSHPVGSTAQNTQAHFAVTDIEALMDQLRERGVTFEEYDFPPFLEMHKGNGLYQMGDYRGGWFKDSEGNTIEIAQVG